MKPMALSVRCVLLLVGVVACSPFGGGGAFHCERDDQCTGGGTCQASGFCSFADPNCPSGQRYGEASGPLSTSCVGDSIDDAIDAPTSTDAPDSAVDASIDAAIDAPPPAPFCDSANEPTLVGCWQFEGNTNDASGDGNNATAMNTMFGTGKVGMGLVMNATSLVTAPDTASLSPPAITVEAFVNPTMLPTGRFGIFDNDSSYGVFINATNVQCATGVSATAPPLQANVWTHVACTFDGTTSRIYINGALAGTTGGGAPLGAGNTFGSVIGGNSPSGDSLVGTIDQLRVWREARTPQQVCAASGAPLCP
jgi:hypothetical protein